MKKMLLLLLLVAIIIVSGCQPIVSTVVTPTAENITQPPSTTIPDPDFRSVNWGMSREQVIEVEGEPDSYGNNGGLVYDNIYVAGHKMSLIYLFNKNILYEAMYKIEGKDANYNTYCELVEQLEKNTANLLKML